MNIPQDKFNFLKQRLNTNLGDLISDSNIPELSSWINSVSGKSKGFAGECFEWIITGKQGDNEPKPDFNGWEIKAMTWDEKKNRFTEKSSLTAVSYSTIEDEIFEISHVLNKSKIISIKLTPNKNPLKRKFVGLGTINLQKYPQFKENYMYYRDLVCKGKAHLFTGSAKVLGENQILHVRTAGECIYKEYITKRGVKYIAKPYNFALDYKVLTKLYTSIF